MLHDADGLARRALLTVSERTERLDELFAREISAIIAREIADRFDVVALAVIHRYGPIPVGEAALVAAVSTAHRGDAFAACAALVDLTKERLPVWKHQVFADGSDEWVNCA